MESKMQKWGNSCGVRIPKVFLDSLNLKSGDDINIEKDENKIIITKVTKEKESLKARIEKYDGPNMCEDFGWDEELWGMEIW